MGRFHRESTMTTNEQHALRDAFALLGEIADIACASDATRVLPIGFDARYDAIQRAVTAAE